MNNKTAFLITLFLPVALLFSKFAHGQGRNNSISTPLGVLSLNVTIGYVSSEIFDGSTMFIYDGVIHVTATGGTAPYAYSIISGAYQYQFDQNNGYFPGLAPGTYPITVTDANGQKIDTTVLVSFAFPQPTVTVATLQMPTACNATDGGFTLMGTEGTPPYSYSIDGGNTYTTNNVFTGLVQGIYPILIKDAKGQLEMIGINSSSPNIPGSIDLVNTSLGGCMGGGIYSITACSNIGYIKASAYSTTPLDSFSLDGMHYVAMIENPFYAGVYNYDSINLAPGLYHVYVKNGSTGAISISADPISKYCNIKITFVNVDASCHMSDGMLTVLASNGVSPYTYTIDGIQYQVSNVFSSLSSGNYSVTVKDASGGSTSQQVTIFNKCPTVSATTTADTCNEKKGSLSANGFKGAAPYLFSIDGVNFQTSNIFNHLTAGNYTITIKDANGFTGTTKAAIINNCIQISTLPSNLHAVTKTAVFL